jgi:hypothetical protein
MRKAGLIVFVLLLFASPSIAQTTSRANAFFGFSYTDANTFEFANGKRLNLSGYGGSVEVKIVPHVGFVAAADKLSGSPSLAILCPGAVVCTPQVVNLHETDFLFGPRVSAPIWKLRPFVEGLVGYAHVQTDQFGPDKSIAEAFGGGVDYKLFWRIGARLEGDYVRTQLFGRTQKDVRLTAGLLYRF